MHPPEEWATTTINEYKNFLDIDTSIYWIIDSIFDFTLNIPKNINNIYVVDITRCFESIPIWDNDTLYDAMEFITNIGMTNMRREHPRSKQLLWIRINDKGVRTKAI